MANGGTRRRHPCGDGQPSGSFCAPVPLHQGCQKRPFPPPRQGAPLTTSHQTATNKRKKKNHAGRAPRQRNDCFRWRMAMAFSLTTRRGPHAATDGWLFAAAHGGGGGDRHRRPRPRGAGGGVGVVRIPNESHPPACPCGRRRCPQTGSRLPQTDGSRDDSGYAPYAAPQPPPLRARGRAAAAATAVAVAAAAGGRHLPPRVPSALTVLPAGETPRGRGG